MRASDATVINLVLERLAEFGWSLVGVDTGACLQGAETSAEALALVGGSHEAHIVLCRRMDGATGAILVTPGCGRPEETIADYSAPLDAAITTLSDALEAIEP